MSSLLHRSRRFIACLAVLTPLAAVSAARADEASAATMTAALASPHDPCGQRLIENPFAQWSDNADYFLVHQGDLSAGAMEWDLGTGGLVAQNNPFSLHGEETVSAGLSEGDSAVAPMVCVGINDPTMRFFVRNPGAVTGTLKVEVLYEDASYNMHSLQLGVLTAADAGDAWTPSPTLLLAAPLVALLDADLTPVWFRFTAQGAGSSWLVDDVYVDPYGKG
jgi:hypothetical protein